MQRKRHMVEIADDSWDKLERLANRLDAAQFVYKGRPRYGKLIELAIEKLEDSTMEWTVEEVLLEEVQEEWWDDSSMPIDEHYTEAVEGWWLANPNITPIKLAQAEKDMALYGNAYIGTDYAKESDSPAISKPIKASSVSFENITYAAGKASESTEKLAASFKLQDQIAQGFVENLGKKMNDALLDGITNAIASKPDPATIHEADVWASTFKTLSGTFITLKARTDKEWTTDETTLVQNAVYKTIAGSATLYSPFHVSFIGGTGFYEYAAVLDVNPKLAKWAEEEAKKALKAILVEKGLSGTKAFKEMPTPKKLANPVPLVMYKMSQPGYIELTGTITQALSAPQQMILRNFAYAAFAEFSSDKGSNALSVTMKAMPWNKLWISATYADPSKLIKKLQDVGETVAKRVEAWLLQGNFIGPLPQAVDITEKPIKNVSCQHKTEKAIDKNGTLQEYDTYNIKVSLTPFDAIALNDNKHEIADRLKILLLSGHGYPIHGTVAGARILWDDDHDGNVRISASIIQKLSSPFKGYSQEFVSQATKYLENIVNAIQNHKAIKSESYNPPIW